MQFTRQAEYAVWIMLDLATQRNDNYLAIRTIADRYSIPAAFLQKTARLLLRAGLVRAQRGAGGGLRLGRAPSEITLLDIVTAVEGDMALNPCLRDGRRCPRMETCRVRRTLSDVQRMLMAELASRRLDELAGVEQYTAGSGRESHGEGKCSRVGQRDA